MAMITSSPVAYDCGTCSKPVYLSTDGWKHNDRHLSCVIETVLEIALFVTKNA